MFGTFPLAARASRRLLRVLLIGVTVALTVTATINAAGANPVAAAPPPVTVLTHRGQPRDGAIFVSPFGDTNQYANGPEILDSHGHVR